MLERFRAYWRRRMPGMTPHVAALHKQRLSVVYAFVTWNLFGLIIYVFMNDRFPKTNNSVDYAKLLGIKETNIIRYEGFRKVEQYHLKLEDSDIEAFHGIEPNSANDGQEKKEKNEVVEKKNNIA